MNQNRRQFIKSAFALSASGLMLPNALAANKHSDSNASAKYRLVFASPYPSDLHNHIPHMHQEFKHFVETMSDGKIAVDIKDNAQIGVGTDLMAAVTRGQVDGALISVSNLSRALPILDILNVPFWVSDDQQYINLISSDYWQQNVLNKIKQQGKVEILFHYLTGARTMSTTTTGKPVKVPMDLANQVIRVPASKVLHQFYTMTRANVIEVAWKDTAKMARLGHINILDPGVIGLYAGPDNLNQSIKTITTLNTVPDAWVNVINQDWLNSLPLNLRLIVKEAAIQTFKAHLKSYQTIKNNCLQSFINLGCDIYQPTETERWLWVEQFGHQRAEWRKVKTKLLGSVAEFDRMAQATQITSNFKVPQ